MLLKPFPARDSIRRRLVWICLTSSLLLSTGCGVTSNLSSDSAVEDGPGGQMSGVLHGGQNPISGATVSLWVAGLTGYGSAPASGTYLATTTTDTNGNFTFGTFTCPTAVSPATASDELVYLTATGGNSGGGTNSSIALMAVLAGPPVHGVLGSGDTCATIKATPPYVGINEITTAESMYALAQFYNPSTGYFGTPATNYQGLISAFNIAGELVATSTGLVNATFQPQGADLTPVGGSATYSNDTATPDADKIVLIADILAACVNSVGSGSTPCTTLFTDAAPPPSASTTTLGSSFSFPVATNTMQAAYYLAVNPINATTAGVPNTASMSALYFLASPTPPFAFSEAQPTDWTISVVYGTSAYGGGTTGFISAPNYLTVDGSGDVLYLTASTTLASAGIGGLNPYGGVGFYGLGTYAPYQGYTIDGSGYGYLSRSGTTATTRTTYTATGATAKYNNQIADSNDSNLVFQPAQFISDGTYVFATTVTSGDAGSIFQIPVIGQTGSPFSASETTPAPFAALNAGNTISALTLTSPIVVDSAKHIYAAAGNALYQTAYSSTLPSGATGATPAVIPGTFVTPTALAVDHSNNVWIANAAGGTPANGYVSYYDAATTTVVQDSVAGDGGVNNPSGVAIDGAGNVWVSSAGSGTSFTGETVSEFALVGGNLKALSPSAGFAHSYNKPGGIAVDLSGNVWVANSGVVANSTTSTPGTITCILGAASPVVVPISKSIGLGTQGTLP